MSLKLNSINRDVFDAKDAEEYKVSLNSPTLSRKAIVVTGRLIAAEYFGSKIN